MTLPGFDRPAIGIGFRKETHARTLEALDEIDVLEVTVDHWIMGTPSVRDLIREVATKVPIVAHGVGLSVGTAVRPDPRYLDEVAAFVEEFHAPWYSEHLAFTKVPGTDLAQLIPVPRTREMAEVLIDNIGVVRQHVPVPLVWENISYYFDWPTADYSEPEFLCTVLQATGSTLLLDLENLYLNATNHGFDPLEFIEAIPGELVRAVHLAGGTTYGPLLIDSHNQPVPRAVLDLFGRLLDKACPDTAIVERDQGFERFQEVIDDVRAAKSVRDRRGAG